MHASTPTFDDRSAGLLTAITAGVAGGDDLADLLHRFLEPIMQLAGAGAGAVRVLDEQRQHFALVSQVGLPADLCSADRPAGRHCGACGAAVDRARVVWADEISPCALRPKVALQGQDCRDVLAVPLQYRGELLGVYNLFFASGPLPDASTAGVLKSVGELLGLALHNARLEAEHLRARVLSERQQMAAEVHDSLAQTLTFVKMRLSVLRSAVQAHDDPVALGYVDELRQAVSEAHAGVREIITHLCVPMDPRGLLPALEARLATFRLRTGVMVEMVLEGQDLALRPEQEEQVYHIVQEALANIAKHAGASHARVALSGDDAGVHVSVEDDGRGIDTQAAGTGFNAETHWGLGLMAQRARRLGGELRIEPRESGGTRVRLDFLRTAARAGASLGAAR